MMTLSKWVAPVGPLKLDNAEFTELKALEVFGPGGRADLAHDLEDAGLLGARKEFFKSLAGNRQLVGCEPAFPHAVGVEDVEPAVAVADVEADGEGIQEPAEDDKNVRLRGCLQHGGERMQC